MLRMLTVTESSDISYSEAAKKAVNALIAKGEKVHFFTVSEQRGTASHGKVEFQVVMQISVE